MPAVVQIDESIHSRAISERASQKLSLWRRVTSSDLGVLVLIAAARVLLHVVVNGRYGFHRDELLTYTNTRHLGWGYVVYPPMTPFLAWLGMALFGNSLRAFRMFAAVAQGLAMLLTGLAARELGGKREAQVLAALATGLVGPSLTHGSFLSYTSFDFPCWILVAYFVIRLLKSEDARWWVAVGGAIGLGMMAKYSMAFFAVVLVGGALLTFARRYLKSPWLWCGAGVALVIMSPNLVWQAQHEFVSLAYLRSIHNRDIGWGWTDYFVLKQFWTCTSMVTVPVWCAGLWYLFVVAEGKRYRLVGWMYVLTFLEFLIAHGREYYLAPAYPMLFAAGAVWSERWLGTLSAGAASSVRRTSWQVLAVAAVISIGVTLPIAPVNSAWWRVANGMNGRNFDMQMGWQEMVETVAKVRDGLPTEKRGKVGILAGDEGETGAVNLYGPSYGLPRAISGMNSNWYRGYGEPEPETVIVLGVRRDFVDRNFESCVLADRVTNQYGIQNATVEGYADVFVCGKPRQGWAEFWKKFRYYG